MRRWLDAVKELELDGVTISSTAIRQALAAGDIAYAARLWGREVEMSGVVEHGFQIAGSKLSAPTANLKSGSDSRVRLHIPPGDIDGMPFKHQ